MLDHVGENIQTAAFTFVSRLCGALSRIECIEFAMNPKRVNHLNPCGPSVSLSASVVLKGQRKRFSTLSVWKSRAAAAQIINTVC